MNKFIVIEGNIGAGKTTLAKFISEQMNANLVLENFENNPFLEAFYQDKKVNAFDTEMFFLKDRIRQLNLMNINEIRIADFSILKSRIFAEINLSKNELKKFIDQFEKEFNSVMQPDVILFLKSDLTELQQKIDVRSREFEKNIEKDYLSRIEGAYIQKFSQLRTIPIFQLEVKNIQFPFNSDEIGSITEILLNADHKGFRKL